MSAGLTRTVASCLFVTALLVSPALAQEKTAPAPTFSVDIAPILFTRCGSCHRPEGVAPFSLLTYAAARQRAQLIAQVTARRLMPPWKSAPGSGEFVGHTPLTIAQIDLLRRWANAGAPEGDSRRLPTVPKWRDGWQLGAPSLTLTFPDPFIVPADGDDFSRIFVLPIPVQTPVFVNGFEFAPGRGGVVHHANIRVDRSAASRELDAQDPAPGYSGLLLSSATYPDGHFLGWTPGQVAPLLPPGLSWQLSPGADLVVEMHFVPNGRPQPVQPSVALYFTTEPPARTPAMLRLGRQSLEIAAGEARYIETDSFVLPVDVEVQALQPHAHYRARDVRATATLPDGSTRSLISIDDWDYRWQHVYRYVTPMALPKGTRLDLRYVFDNSAANVRNPQQPPRPVHWGQRSIDEMGDLWVQMLTRSEPDRQVLNQALHAKHTAEEIVGYETMIRDEPARVSLRNDIAVRYVESGQPDKAIRHLEAVVQLEPSSASARYNLGTALSAGGNVSDAVAQYREALRLRPDYALARNNLGHALLVLDRGAEAETEFRAAARLDPENASVHYNIGMLARARGDMPEAISQLRDAVRLQPDWAQALASLAWALTTNRSATPSSIEEAVTFAERAARLTSRRNASVLDVLAAAHAAAGDFARAVLNCDAALALAPDEPLATAIRQRRALYGERRMYVGR